MSDWVQDEVRSQAMTICNTKLGLYCLPESYKSTLAFPITRLMSAITDSELPR